MDQKIVLDTNYYIRFLARDDENMYKIAEKFFLDLEQHKITIFLPDLILAEIVYVLYRLYGFDRSQICSSLQSILALDKLEMLDKNLNLTALEFFGENNLDFADCFLLALQDNSNFKIHTFDKKLMNKL